LADVAEVTVTPVTLAPIPLASGSLLNESMAEENVLPFCSSATRWDSGVLELKNFSQFAVIAATAPALPEVAGADDAGTVDGDPADEFDEDDGGGGDVDEELELLHAVTASASARPITGARMIRRASNGNRMTRP
jgi:hypothetical protein